MSNQLAIYRGWRINYSASRPVTGQFRAERAGVGLCASTRSALEMMVDAKNQEFFQRFPAPI